MSYKSCWYIYNMVNDTNWLTSEYISFHILNVTILTIWEKILIITRVDSYFCMFCLDNSSDNGKKGLKMLIYPL